MGYWIAFKNKKLKSSFIFRIPSIDRNAFVPLFFIDQSFDNMIETLHLTNVDC